MWRILLTGVTGAAAAGTEGSSQPAAVRRGGNQRLLPAQPARTTSFRQNSGNGVVVVGNENKATATVAQQNDNNRRRQQNQMQNQNQNQNQNQIRPPKPMPAMTRGLASGSKQTYMQLYAHARTNERIKLSNYYSPRLTPAQSY